MSKMGQKGRVAKNNDKGQNWAMVAVKGKQWQKQVTKMGEEGQTAKWQKMTKLTIESKLEIMSNYGSKNLQNWAKVAKTLQCGKKA